MTEQTKEVNTKEINRHELSIELVKAPASEVTAGVVI